MSKYYYITTPIYYVNDKPHIGHTYTDIACDILARFKRMDGFNVIFLTGTDEHGQKVEKSAIAKHLSPQEFADEVSQTFKDLTPLLKLTNDDFIRTTQERHEKAVAALWEKISANGYIYKGKYSGWYAIKDEAFYNEDELIKKNDKLVAPSGAEVEWREEESYFFKLSAFQDKLLEYYNNYPEFIAPKSRFNEVYSFVKRGLTDLSISRSSFTWGIPVPGDSSHVIYVWLDALTNYISELGYPNVDDKFFNFWQNSLHMVGKDIIRFHGIYWPAFLMAADLPLPKRIFAHGWWLNEGEKISKSAGNVIDPHEIINKYGLDSVRYFLFREVPFGNDGDFSHEAIKNRINNDLANGYGNLLQRSLSMLHKSFEGKIPAGSLNEEQNLFLDKLILELEEHREHIYKQEFSKYLERVFENIRYGNAYMNDTAPWNLLKEGKTTEAGEALVFILEIVRIVAIYLYPFMPDTSLNVFNQLNISWDRNLNSLSVRLKEGHQLNAPTPIFTKILD
ncbi:MAG: methionine--tRNA ligase [Alphaproteobacteria bacterium]|nr:methionine--tRNA ligase [Alphaproteobacteria bacterium]